MNTFADRTGDRAGENAPQTGSRSAILCETWADFLSEARLDRDGGLVCNVALLGMESRNGYRYREEAMREATPLYEGRPVFIDHPDPPFDRGGLPHQRKLRDYAGKVLQPRFEAGRIRGDLCLRGPNAGWLMNLIESAPEDIGMSHVVAARRAGAGTEVEKIERVILVDIVAFPATTRSFAESFGRFAHPAYAHASSLPFADAGHLPDAGRGESLEELLRDNADPQRIIAILERWLRTVCSETPRSLERNDPARVRPTSQQQLLSAIRGE